MSTVIIFSFSYIISCCILVFLGSKLNWKKWFSKNNTRKVIAFIISFVIYMVGCIIIDRVNITGNFNTVLRGILLSTIIIPITFGMSNVSKDKKVN
ncbi:hypothetical protein [Clostridium fungisolvens]|uniref:Uncharacterized protein n=1 Tax=Clostridium fungisolvens TaxID=1604897 RepID=A0A6V8SGA8_9CLOT|nr:hypothetical protein [Clostridium fungisolvens]GFP76249.1 hypothetical protein bsdtw1_02350 [Clostridium fungisolvens]